MRNSTWTSLLLAGAVILITGYQLMNYLSSRPTVDNRPLGTAAMPAQAWNDVQQVTENPLLHADKAAVSRWFPGNCFAEIYMKNKSFGGKLVKSCKASVITEVQNETRYPLTESDFETPEVLIHFKSVYGADGPWIR